MNDFEGCTYSTSAHLPNVLGLLEITRYGAFVRVGNWIDEAEERYVI